MSADNVTPIKRQEVVSVPVSRLHGILEDLDTARAAVFVCAQALGTGDERTDLESHSSTALKTASVYLEEVYDRLLYTLHPSPEEGEEGS